MNAPDYDKDPETLNLNEFTKLMEMMQHHGGDAAPADGGDAAPAKRGGRDRRDRGDRKKEDRRKSGSPGRGGKGRKGRKGRDSDSDSDDDMAREYWNKFARMDFGQFAKGYRHAEQGVTDEEIRDSFLWGDKNGDFELNFHEFKRMITIKQGPPDHSDEASMKWYWKNFASYKDKGMTIEEFFMGSRIEHPDMPYEQVEEIFRELDHNGDWRLSRSEFMSMSEMEGHDNKRREDMNADDYWQHFSKGGVMDYDSFAEAYQQSLECVTPEMISAAWNDGDNNRDKMMDKGEFMDMVQRYEAEAKVRDSMTPDDYWNKFSDGKGMNYEAFAKGYRYAEECVDDKMIDEAFKMGD